jgi:hypothetical protein
VSHLEGHRSTRVESGSSPIGINRRIVANARCLPWLPFRPENFVAEPQSPEHASRRPSGPPWKLEETGIPGAMMAVFPLGPFRSGWGGVIPRKPSSRALSGSRKWSTSMDARGSSGPEAPETVSG